MFSTVTAQRSRWRILWPDVTDLDGARKAIQLGYRTCFVLAGLNAVATPVGGSAFLADAAAFGVLGLALRKNSRTAAVMAVALILAKITWTVWQGSLVGLVAGIWLVGLLSATRGAFAHWNLVHGEPAPTGIANAGPASISWYQIDGWLLVFAILEVLRCSTAIYNLVASPSSFTVPGRNLQMAVPWYLVYVLFQHAVLITNGTMPIVGLVLLVGRSRWAPAFLKLYLAFVVFDGLVEMVALRLLYPSLAAAFRGAGNSLAPLDEASVRYFRVGLREAAYGTIWLVYWVRSSKVRRLFSGT